jgi:hypothetical protein
MENPLIRIIRLEQSDEGALGSLVLKGALFCTTLEPDEGDPVKHQIPAGRYPCKRFHGVKWPDTYEIIVPGHTAVLFHAGNTEEATQMCVILGQYPGKLKMGAAESRAILNSGNTFKNFMAYMNGKEIDEFDCEFINFFPGSRSEV